jgi:O-antigen ligase
MQRSVASPAALRRWRPPLAVAAGTLGALLVGYFSAARSPLIVGGVVLGALLAVWALRRYEVALYGLVAITALLPFAVVPVRVAVAPTLLDLATAGIFLLWLARAALRRCETRLTAVGVALAAYAGVAVAAYAFSAESLRPDETARLFAKVVAAHLLFVPVLNLVSNRRLAERLATWLVLVAAIEAVAGIALYVVPRGVASRALNALGTLGYPTGDSVLRYRPDTDILRATGTAVDPNMLGALLMVAAALALPQLLASRPVVSKPLIVACLAPIGLCLLLTESRGSWLGLLAGLLLIGGLRYRRLWIALALVVALSFALPQAQRFTSHLASGLQVQDRASALRIGELQNALEIIGRHPWFGVGWAAEGQSIELEFTFGVSNIYLTVAERSGLVALLGYLAALAALASVVWPALRRRRGDLPDDGLLPGLAAALVATQVAGLVDHHFVRFPHLVSLLWTVAALAVSVSLHQPPAGTVPAEQSLPERASRAASSGC